VTLLISTPTGFTRRDFAPWDFESDSQNGGFFKKVHAADFNRDNKNDLILSGCCLAGAGRQALLLGNGDGTFGVARPFGNLDARSIISFQLDNKDGYLDLLVEGTCGGGGCNDARIDIFRNTGNGQFTLHTTANIGDDWTDLSNVVLGDFDRDGDFNFPDLDFARVGRSALYHSNFLLVWPRKADGTLGEPYRYPISTVTDPSLALISLQPFDDRHPSFHDLVISSTAGGFFALDNVSTRDSDCLPPANREGVRVCTPESGVTSSPVKVKSVAVMSGDRTPYRFELWIDHVKAETARDSKVLNTTLNLPFGDHLLEFVARNLDGSERKTATSKIYVGNECDPFSQGISICGPVDGATVTRTFPVKAYAYFGTQPMYRFELWANNVKVVTVRDIGEMNTNLTLAPGSYRLDFVARGTAGGRLTKSINVTVR
jgi:hypothetical protein